MSISENFQEFPPWRRREIAFSDYYHYSDVLNLPPRTAVHRRCHQLFHCQLRASTQDFWAPCPSTERCPVPRAVVDDLQYPSPPVCGPGQP